MPRRHFANGLQQRIQTFALARGRGHHRHAQIPRQPPVIHGDAVTTRLIDQVQADDGAVSNFQHLQRQIQVALQSRGVHHNNRHIRLAEEDKIAGHLLVQTGGKQRVGAGQIDNFVALVAVAVAALGAGHRFAWPIAGMLAQAGQGIKDGTLAGIRIAGQGNHVVPIGHIDAQLKQITGIVRRTGGAAGGGSGGRCGIGDGRLEIFLIIHVVWFLAQRCASACGLRMRIRLACSWRRAMRASRMM